VHRIGAVPQERESARYRERCAGRHQDAKRLDMPPFARRARQHASVLQETSRGHAEAYR